MHKRTNPWPSFFSRIQMGVISRHVTRLIFITENEERNYIDLGGRPDHGQVIYNIVPQVEKGVLPLELISNSNRFKICCLANYSYYRGIDRLIDIAIVLQKSHGGKFIFIVAGDISLTKSLPGKLGEVARSGGNLSDYARIMGVEEMFLFLGHVSNPEKVLAGCNALIRPSRENNPWGRDVLEAMSSSLPVIATGSYNRFVEDGVTGFLLKEFNSNKISEYIVELSLDRKKAENMGSQGCKRVQNLCGGVNRSKDLLKFWKDVCKV
jgi:glycosyltransferase involved in cell wall biosynthesis